MFRGYVLRGAKAGLVAGLAFGLFVAFVTNPLVAAAEAGGHGGDAGHGHAAADRSHAADDHGHAADDHSHASEGAGDAVSTALTDAIGVAGGVLWGVLLGLAFGVALFFLEPTLPGGDLGGRLALAAAGFLTVSGVPWLVQPPLAPGAEPALATGTRLAWYGAATLAGGTACAGALATASWTATGRRRLVAIGCGLTVVPIVALLLAAPTAAWAGSATTGASTPLQRALVGAVVVGQGLLWTLLAGVDARLASGADPVDDPDLDDLDDELVASGV